MKICKKKPPRTVLVKIRISPNEIVILQYIAEEVDSVWVVPVGHTHSRVTWPKIWSSWVEEMLAHLKIESFWKVLFAINLKLTTVPTIEGVRWKARGALVSMSSKTNFTRCHLQYFMVLMSGSIHLQCQPNLTDFHP